MVQHYVRGRSFFKKEIQTQALLYELSTWNLQISEKQNRNPGNPSKIIYLGFDWIYFLISDI
jgi:hypothetical protein